MEFQRFSAGYNYFVFLYKSKKEDKDQESIQSSNTPCPGYQWESDVTIRHHK